MKKTPALALLVLPLLAACAPLEIQPNDARLSGVREGAQVRAVATVGPRLGLSSSEAITAFAPLGPVCVRVPTDAEAQDGQLHAIACASPVTAVATTDGAVILRVRDGNTTVAGPVRVPPAAK